MATIRTLTSGESFVLESVDYISSLQGSGDYATYDIKLVSGGSVCVFESDYPRATLMADLAALP